MLNKSKNDDARFNWLDFGSSLTRALYQWENLK